MKYSKGKIILAKIIIIVIIMLNLIRDTTIIIENMGNLQNLLIKQQHFEPHYQGGLSILFMILI